MTEHVKRMSKPTRAKGKPRPHKTRISTFLRKLYAEFQQQIEAFEQRVTTKTGRERDAKSLGALAATLDRLYALEKEMKKTYATTEKGKSGFDRDGVIRKLCDRLEKLVRGDGVERKDQQPSDNAER